jgi:sugar transferase (PEP-CTERM system associated)
MRLFNRYFSSFDLLLVLGDFLLTIGATSLVRWGAFVYSDSFGKGDWSVWFTHSLGMAAVIVISFYYSDLYAIDQTLSDRELILRFVGGLGVACVVIGAISYPIPNFGKTVYLSEIFVLGIVLGFWRIGLMRVIGQAPIHAKVLVIGIQEIGKIVAEELWKKPNLGMEVVGFAASSAGEITLSFGNPRKKVLPVIATDRITAFIEQSGVNRVLLAESSAWPDHLAEGLLALRTRGIPVEDCHTFYERLVSKIAIRDLSTDWIVRSGGFRREPLVLLIKRILDIVASSIGLILAAPLALVVAILIRLESKGSVFFHQDRVGQFEKIFALYKFRSMTADAEATTGPVWATRDDPRVTRIGRLMRKLRIDEIPQMYNVLKGDMSFVGPRPERPFFVKTLKARIPFYDLRHSVKPGVTGWAQISCAYGDSEAGAIEKLQYDLYYIKHMNVLFDLQIIFESLKVVLLGKGAQ